MPAPNNPLIVKVALVYTRDTRTFVNTFHVYKTGGWTIPAMSSLATAFTNWWINFGRLGIPSVVFLVRVEVRLLDPDNPLAFDYNLPVPVNGSRVVAAEAANASLAISWRTDYAGRAYRGRTYVPSLAEPDVTQDDRVSSGPLATFANAATQLLAAMVTEGAALAIFHRNDNLFSIITRYVVDALVDSMRRRLPGRGI